MPLKIIEDKSTGIYRERISRAEWNDGKLPRTKRDFETLNRIVREIATGRDVYAELDRVENAAREIIKSCGGTPGPVKRKRQGRVIGAEWFPLPSGAPPDALRARNLIFEIWAARDDLKRGRLEAAAMAAYRVGRLAEKTRVSPFEPIVRAGKKAQSDLAAGRTRHSDERATVRRYCLRTAEELRVRYPPKVLTDNFIASRVFEKICRLQQLGEIDWTARPSTIRRYLREARKKSNQPQ